MIYFTNAPLKRPHMAFIGRWSPLHLGHAAIIIKKMKENPGLPVLIMVRDTQNDQYPAHIRAEYVKLWMTGRRIRGTIMIVPNIEGVYWGRKVGYNTGQIDVDQMTEKISGTVIRNTMKTNSPEWKKRVADKENSPMLSPAVSGIVDNGLVVWLTGCPSSGKTTIAHALVEYIQKHFPFLKYQLLDGDAMRASPIAQNTGFSKTERLHHLKKMAFLASMFANHGILVICAFVSPYARSRDDIRRIIGKKRFREVYVYASKKTRMKRDTKGLYKKAASGHLEQLTGYNDIYEVPVRPDVRCNTDTLSIQQCVDKIAGIVFKHEA